MQVVEEAGRLKEIAIVGIDGENNAFQAIKWLLEQSPSPSGLIFFADRAQGARFSRS